MENILDSDILCGRTHCVQHDMAIFSPWSSGEGHLLIAANLDIDWTTDLPTTATSHYFWMQC